MSRGNLTRTIAPKLSSDGTTPVSLAIFDDKDNVVQTVTPKGVRNPPPPDDPCESDLSGEVDLNGPYVTTYGYDASRFRLESISHKYSDVTPSNAQHTATTTFA